MRRTRTRARLGARVRWLAAVAGVCAGAVVSGAQDPVFRARVDGVRIDVLVTERDRPVAGLGPADFEVRDMGVPQAVDFVALGDVPVSVVLALDLSSSVRGPKLEALRRAGHAVVDALRPEDRVALLTFNTATVLPVPLTHERTAIRRALDGAEGRANTALVDAALSALLLGDADAGRTLIVVFSDGVDTASFSDPRLVLDTAKRVNAVVYGVTARDEDARFLQDLATATGGRVLELGPSDDPGPAFVEILQEFRRRYVLTFSPTGTSLGGWHPLEVRVKRPGVRVQARPGYFAAAP